jgi:hypothetical protein
VTVVARTLMSTSLVSRLGLGTLRDLDHVGWAVTAVDCGFHERAINVHESEVYPVCAMIANFDIVGPG